MTQTRTIAVAGASVIALVVISALLFQWPLEKAALLAPVIVVTAGATAFIFVLWGKIAWEALRTTSHPFAIGAGIVGVIALLLVISFFVEMPAYR